MKLEHRFANVQDAPMLAPLNKQLIEDEGHNNPMNIAELSARMRRWLDRAEYTGLLFMRAGALVGYVLYRIEDRHAYIRHFFVQRDSRRAGVGREMMRLLRETIIPDRRITLEVLSHNERARAFYAAVGFREYAVIMEST